MTDVAILHDRVPQIGGGERFAIEAARALDAPIYTMYVASGTEIPDDVSVIPIRQKKYTGLVTKRFLEWKNRGMNPLETLNVAMDMTDAQGMVNDYDVVLESAPLSKSYVPSEEQRVVHYPHSPPRWLYDLYQDRLSGFDYPIVGFMLRMYADYHRALDKARNDYVDTFVANSKVVQDRIRRFYGRDSEVVYPPVTGDWRNKSDEGFFITWSRLEPDKRVDLIVEAFTRLDETLYVAGEGSQRSKLEKIAAGHDNIKFMGYVEDIESVVARSTAVVYAPKEEDFGLVGAETLTAGKPLIGVDEGFTKHQVIEGVTGVRFNPATESLCNAILSFDPEKYDSSEIRSYSERYSLDTFRSSIREVVL